MRVLCVLTDDATALPFLAESCGALSKKVALGEGALFLDLGRSAKFATPQVEEKLRALGELFSAKLKIGIGADCATARAMALTGIKKRRDFPLHTIPFFLDPFFPTQGSQLRLQDLMEYFKTQNWKTFSDLVNSQKTSNSQRWQQEINFLLQRWEAPCKLEWPKFVASDPLREHCRSSAELGLTVSRLLARLHGRNHFLLRLTLRSNSDERVVHVSRAQNSSMLLLPMIEEALGQLAEPKTEVVFEVTESLFGLNSEGAEKEVWRSLFSLLHERLWKNERALPLQNSPVSTDPQGQGVLFPFASRPMALLRRPEPIQMEAQTFVRQGKSCGLLELRGPAKIAGEWWFQERERNYYQAELANGEKWWVFTNDAKEIFLHGILN